MSNIFITNDFQQNDDESIAFTNLCNFLTRLDLDSFFRKANYLIANSYGTPLTEG